MNCKQGDIALVVRSIAGNEGRVVTCLEIIGNVELANKLDVKIGDGVWWKIDTLINFRVDYASGRSEIRHNCLGYVNDSQLLPIGNSTAKLDSEVFESSLAQGDGV